MRQSAPENGDEHIEIPSVGDRVERAPRRGAVRGTVHYADELQVS
jgi:hypothetical protein